MKIAVKHDQVTVTSTNGPERDTLLKVFVDSLAPTKPKGKRNNYKGKHKKECETCGKKYKNVRLHMYKKHGTFDVTSITAPTWQNLTK